MAVEYTSKAQGEEDNELAFEVRMIRVMKQCRVCVVRKRRMYANGEVRMNTSIWALSDDDTIRMQQSRRQNFSFPRSAVMFMAGLTRTIYAVSNDDDVIPFMSYFAPEKVAVTVPTHLLFHDVMFGLPPVQTARTTWVNYIFEDAKSTS